MGLTEKVITVAFLDRAICATRTTCSVSPLKEAKKINAEEEIVKQLVTMLKGK